MNAGERLVTVLQQEPLVALARPPIRWIQRTPTSGTLPGRILISQDPK